MSLRSNNFSGGYKTGRCEVLQLRFSISRTSYRSGEAVALMLKLGLQLSSGRYDTRQRFRGLVWLQSASPSRIPEWADKGEPPPSRKLISSLRTRCFASARFSSFLQCRTKLGPPFLEWLRIDTPAMSYAGAASSTYFQTGRSPNSKERGFQSGDPTRPGVPEALRGAHYPCDRAATSISSAGD